MSQIDYQTGRVQVLQRLHQKYDSLGDFMRNLPTIAINDSLISPNDAIREVDHLSEEGKKIIAALMGT